MSQNQTNKVISPNPAAGEALKWKSHVNDLIRRTNDAGPHPAKLSTEWRGDWEIVDKAGILEYQDRDEYVLVGKTKSEMRVQEKKKGSR